MDYINYIREGSKRSGSVQLPDPEDLSYAMFSRIAELEKEVPASDDMEPAKVKAFRLGLIVQELGKWEIDGLTLKDFNKWRNSPDDANFRLCVWMANVYTDYQQRVQDPNGLAAS